MLLFVGRLQALKGVDLALETLIELRARGRNAMLAIVGGPSGPDGRDTLAQLHRRVEEAGVIEHVSFVAPQSHQLLSTWMRASDVMLVPSRTESFGLVALESSACGTPVVASDVGGLMTLIEPGRDRILGRRARPPGVGRRRGGDARSPELDHDVQRGRPARAALHLALGRGVARRPHRGVGALGARSLLSERAPLGDADSARRLDDVVSSWATQWQRQRPVGRRTPTAGRRPRSLPLAHPTEGRGEGRHHAVALAASANGPRGDRGHPGAGGEIARRCIATCLMKNAELRELHLAIGPEDGIYLMAQIPIVEMTVGATRRGRGRDAHLRRGDLPDRHVDGTPVALSPAKEDLATTL